MGFWTNTLSGVLAALIAAAVCFLVKRLFDVISSGRAEAALQTANLKNADSSNPFIPPPSAILFMFFWITSLAFLGLICDESFRVVTTHPQWPWGRPVAGWVIIVFAAPFVCLFAGYASIWLMCRTLDMRTAKKPMTKTAFATVVLLTSTVFFILLLVMFINPLGVREIVFAPGAPPASSSKFGSPYPDFEPPAKSK